ncbi:AbrB family transcriptional regulator, partial [Priestia megaterium]|uniref:AbrB family transcriptional regulator n=1 Tax=Priestia megaterium TaxID=1404 RepID=UPI001C99F10C
NIKTTPIVPNLHHLAPLLIPIHLPKLLTIKQKQPIQIFLHPHHIILHKYKPHNQSIITPQLTSQNTQYAKPILLSPPAAQIL